MRPQKSERMTIPLQFGESRHIFREWCHLPGVAFEFFLQTSFSDPLKGKLQAMVQGPIPRARQVCSTHLWTQGPCPAGHGSPARGKQNPGGFTKISLGNDAWGQGQRPENRSLKPVFDATQNPRCKAPATAKKNVITCAGGFKIPPFAGYLKGPRDLLTADKGLCPGSIPD